MNNDNKLMDMLTAYAASHQHPFNIFVHMVGIPTIMFGVLIPLTWTGVHIGGITINLAHVAMSGFFLFYLTLDKMFAAGAFLGGYAAQFIGHAVEKSMPVLLKHPIRAHIASRRADEAG